MKSQISVHTLQRIGSDENPKALSSSLTLDQANALVSDGFHRDGWRWPRQQTLPLAAALVSANAFVYLLAPPHIAELSPHIPAQSTSLKPWGHPASPAEIFSLGDLTEFENACFDSRDPSSSVRGARRSLSSLSSPAPSKRIKLDDGPLHEAIPYPHFFIGPSTNMHADMPDTERISRTFKHTPTPLSSHTPDSVSTLLSSKHSRVAWIVPVRGVPPWPHATGAEFALSDTTPPAAAAAEERLTWTRPALRTLWRSLISALESAPPALGFVSLSFNPADAPHPLSHSNSPRDASTSRTPRHWLRIVDHIAIQCDAWRAPVVRTFLGTAGPFPFRDEDGEETRIRVLAGARLVLVDHLGRDVLLY